jgi:transcription-repair coupling factor (superfamily II helicase)
LTAVELGFSTYIPRNYIPSDSQRMGVYRQIASAKTTEDLARLTEQLADMYGSVCGEVKSLIDIAEIRILASAYNIRSITTSGKDLVFSFTAEAGKNIADIFAKSLRLRLGYGGQAGIVRIPDSATVHIRLDEKYFEPNTLLAMLRKILRKRG